MDRLPWLTVILVLLPTATAQNSTNFQRFIQRSWSGAAYAQAPSTQGLYLQKPTATITDAQCAPQTGYPSQCPLELMSLDLDQRVDLRPNATTVKFNMTFFGDVFINSPNATGFYGMPTQCRYSRMHQVLAEFNESTGVVLFTVVTTMSDYTYCTYLPTPAAGATIPPEISRLPGERCPNGYCYGDLVGKEFNGLFSISQPSPSEYRLDLTIAFPYKVYGSGSWSDFKYTSGQSPFVLFIITPTQVLDVGTILTSHVIMYTLTSPRPFRPAAWFADRRPVIRSIEAPFGPQEGGTIITINGAQFSSEPTAQRQRRVVLSHDGDGGAVRECCNTTTISDTQMTCRLPRVSCLSSNQAVPCPQPGLRYANQTVAIAIKPNVKGYDPAYSRNLLDNFVEYEGVWELLDEDVYGGRYVSPADRVAGERHILLTQRTQAVQSCCPVCPTPGDPTCRITISQSVTEAGTPNPGVYQVTVPSFMNPNKGPCDAASNYINTTLTLGIELSSDPTGFTPSPPLSITSCMDQVGICRSYPRVSLRTTCKQLIWSTGAIESSIPPGQTVEVFSWRTNSQCDRRLRCVSGACALTTLADTSAPGAPKLQRRAASAQIGLEVAYMNPRFDPTGFLTALAGVLLPPGGDPRRLQLLQSTVATSVPLSILGTTFAVRETFRKSDSGLCSPDPGITACSMYAVIAYALADGPGAAKGSESLVQSNLRTRATAVTGDPSLRELGIYTVCFDQSTSPALAAAGDLSFCAKVQYPGVISLEGDVLTADGAVAVRVREAVWAYAAVNVTRKGGSDLGATVDYYTAQRGNGTGFARGGGVDYASKVGQLRWLPGDAATKTIKIPIRADGVCEPGEVFYVYITNVANASMAGNQTQAAAVTIVGINDWPDPLYTYSVLRVLGAVCGAATAVPLALFLARIIRSVMRDLSHGAQNRRDIVDSVRAGAAGAGKAAAPLPKAPGKAAR